MKQDIQKSPHYRIHSPFPRSSLLHSGQPHTPLAMQLSYILPQHLPIPFYSTFGLINPRSVIFLPSATAQSCIYTAQHTGAEGYSHTQVIVNKV